MLPWLAREDEVLITRHAAGATDATIAVELGRTAQAVKRRRERLAAAGGVDLVREAAVPIDRERLRELHAQGLPTRDLALALGATVRTVQQLLHEAGLRAHRAGRDDVQLRALLAQGLSRREIGERLGVSQPTLRAWIGRVATPGSTARP